MFEKPAIAMDSPPGLTPRPLRKDVMLAATIVVGTMSIPVRIRNLTYAGAMIDGDWCPRIGAAVTLRRLDNFHNVRDALRQIADKTGDWAGIPMPIDGEQLVIEPKFPMGADLAKIGAPAPEPDLQGVRFINRWYSRRLRLEVYVWEAQGEKGKRRRNVGTRRIDASQTTGVAVSRISGG